MSLECVLFVVCAMLYLGFFKIILAMLCMELLYVSVIFSVGVSFFIVGIFFCFFSFFVRDSMS